MGTELVCLFDEDFALVRVNEPWCQFFGVTEQIALGRSFIDFVPRRYRRTTQNDILALGKGPRFASYRHAAGCGVYTIGWVQWTYCVILDGKDRIAAYEAVGKLAPRRWSDQRQSLLLTNVD